METHNFGICSEARAQYIFLDPGFCGSNGEPIGGLCGKGGVGGVDERVRGMENNAGVLNAGVEIFQQISHVCLIMYITAFGGAENPKLGFLSHRRPKRSNRPWHTQVKMKKKMKKQRGQNESIKQ